MTLPVHLALVSMTPAVDVAAVSTFSAAIQRQIVRDVSPIWDVPATIDTFAATRTGLAQSARA